MHSEHSYEEGKQIKFRCQSCSEITLHTIIDDSDEDSELAIQCSVCDETQEYRPKKNPLKSAAAGKKAAGIATPEHKEKCDLADFKKLSAKNDASTAIPYETTSSYKADDVINHRTFGVGFVRRTIFPNKIEVLFSVGSKLLVCAPRKEPIASVEDGGHSKKGHSNRSRNPSSWQPWSSNPEEKREQKFSWGEDDDSSAGSFDEES
nr:hypothetical protein [Desulfobulbaceae bacterium]